MKNRILLLATIGIIVIIIGLSFILQNNSKSVSTSNSNTAKQPQTRGWMNNPDEVSLYQFPVTVLSAVSEENGLYIADVSPFNSVTEEFKLTIGPKGGQLSFGNCEYDKRGEITGSVTWTITPIEKVIQEINIGDTLLIRLNIPLNPTNEQMRYKEETLKTIAKIEKKEKVDFLSPTEICIQQK